MRVPIAISGLGLIAGVLAIVGSIIPGRAGAAGPAANVTPVPPGNPPCIGMPPLGDLRQDPALAVSGFAASVATVAGVDEVTLRWQSPPASSGLRCLALYTKPPHGAYPATVQVYPFLGSSITLRPGPEPGTWCYTVVALSADRKGPPSEACVQVAHPSTPIPPDQGTPSPAASPSPSPSPVGTPWPAPRDVRVTVSFLNTNPDGSFIPPDQRTATVNVTWQAFGGFGGVYLVERALVPRGSSARSYQEVGRLSGNTDPMVFRESVPFLDTANTQRCYRIRTLIAGETGPYSAEACTTLPPTSGPPDLPFNWDIVKEVVVPLIGDDGRTHYVTLSQDTAGIVRVRLSLFNFPSGPYNIVIFRKGDCRATGSFGPADVITPNFPLDLEPQSVGHLVLHFFNTDSISILPGPTSIYDADGTSLAIYRPGDSGAGPVACAVLSSQLVAPKTGSVAAAGDGGRSLELVALAAAAAGLAAGAATIVVARRR